ncbi:hypothetical protein [Sphingomonas sp. GC_Shp_6]|uniref:hypothetical protein n=1 Tax=Sphingomonas sp. GC_Shp_6 TaxID=2937378 RepID=UPI002269CC52|nr:hypothetical protein [Sphingomonas sp. GC_Shp_6]
MRSNLVSLKVPRVPKLKVYRTPIGFHDAYVAASSQKAALQAWGSDADLFARGIAEVVTDEALTTEPLASPGVVIRKLRGTADEQLEAAKMPKREGARSRDDQDEESDQRRRSRSAVTPKAAEPPRPPLPNRAALDAAEKAIEEARSRHDDDDRQWRKRQEALDRERRQIDAAHEEEVGHLTEDVDRLRRAYDKAMRLWNSKR